MRKCKLFVSVISVLVLCCGCWDKQELEDNTFAVLLGIDKADEKDVLITVAFPLTQLEGGKQGEGGSNGEYSIMSVKASSLLEGLNLFSTKLAGPLSIFSLKTVVISQELAESDMLRHVFSSWRYEQTRNTTNVLISQCDAAEFIDARLKDPAIDVLRQEELLLEQANNSSYYKPVQLLDLVINLKSTGAGSVAMYGGVVSKEDEKSDTNQGDTMSSGEEKNDKEENNGNQQQPGNETQDSGDTNQDADIKESVKNGYLPGEIPLKSDNESQICGLAVFKGNKMAGTLDSMEAQTYSMLTQSKARKILTIPDPLEPEHHIVISILPTRSSTIHSYLDADMPVFDIGVDLNCTVECVQSDVDYRNDDNFAILTEYIREMCTKKMDSLISKIQKEFDADILKLGDKLAYHFLTVDEWNDFNWENKYMDAQINVKASLKIDRTGILMP